MVESRPSPARRVPDSAGFTLIETLIALTVLLIAAAGILPLGLLAVSTSENEGHLMTRTTEYAQDKVEQLMALSYADATSDTRVFPAADLGGTGLTPGGNANPDAAVAGYVDYLDPGGTLIPAAGNAEPAGWYYKRAWSVAVTQPNLKLITVTVTVRTAGAMSIGRTPRTTVSIFKTSPF